MGRKETISVLRDCPGGRKVVGSGAIDLEWERADFGKEHFAFSCWVCKS